MISYNARAARALAFLKRAYNDVEIFVEDTTSLNMWTKLLRAMLPDHLRLTSINMLGGRENVIKACQLDQASDGRQKLYIIDGDLDYLCGRRKRPLKFLYRLRAYCVENLLISKHSLVEIAFDSDACSSRSDAEAKLDYANSLAQFDDLLKSLFVIYATASMLDSRLTTVKFPVEKLLDSSANEIRLSKAKIQTRCKRLLRELCREKTAITVRTTRRTIAARATDIPTSMSVSGKDYLLPAAHLHLRRSCGYRGTIEQLKAHLARVFDPNSEPYLKRRMQALAK